MVSALCVLCSALSHQLKTLVLQNTRITFFEAELTAISFSCRCGYATLHQHFGEAYRSIMRKDSSKNSGESGLKPFPSIACKALACRMFDRARFKRLGARRQREQDFRVTDLFSMSYGHRSFHHPGPWNRFLHPEGMLHSTLCVQDCQRWRALTFGAMSEKLVSFSDNLCSIENIAWRDLPM